MSVAVLIPARLASTRLPRKLLLNQTGRSVLAHTVGQALAAQALKPGLITRVLAACDDQALVAAAREAGAEAVMTRADHTCGGDRIAEAAEKIDESMVVNLQADEPEMDPGDIVKVAELLQEAPETVSMSTLAVPILDEATWKTPSVVKVVVDSNGRALYFSRAPIPYVRESPGSVAGDWPWTSEGAGRVFGLHHLGIYAYRRSFLLGYKNLPASKLEQLECLEQLRALEAGHPIQVGLAKACPPGIDTPEAYQAFVDRWKQKEV